MDFTVQYSADVSAWNNTDDSMWSDVDDGATFKESGNFDALFKEPVKAQYIRITMTVPGLHGDFTKQRVTSSMRAGLLVNLTMEV